MKKITLLSLLLSFSSICFSQAYFDIGANNQQSQNQSTQFLPTSFGNAKNQFLLTNSELVAAGIPIGASIIGLEWYVVTDNTPSTSTYDLYITDDFTGSSMPTGAVFATISPILVGSNLTDVGTYSGWHTANFTTAHVWDGTDNIVFQLCRAGGSQGGDDQIALFNGAMDLMVTGYMHSCGEATGVYTNTNRPFFRIIVLSCANTNSSITETACDSYTSPSSNNVWTTSNTYIDTIPNTAGCDSIITINLTINNSNTGTDTQVACNTYTWIDGNTYTADNNTATFTLINAAGCDSVVTLDLTINNSTTGTDTQVACNNYTWIDMVNYTANNSTATHLIVGGANNGCDSIVTLDLTITNVVYGIDTQTACDTYTWPLDGNTYTASNNTATFTIAGGSITGCDSTITLNLTITNATIGTDVQTACNNYTWIDMVNYTANNSTATHRIVGGANNGCDSIVTLNLTITNAANSTDLHTACSNFTWIDGINYTASNNTAIFTITDGAINGCDSIITLNLTISTNNTISLGEDLYICEETVTVSPGLGYSSYQWSDGTTNSSLSTDIYGVYSVTVTDIDGCTGYDEVELIKDCPANVWVPNVFSPNGDGKNEIFTAVGDNLTGFSLKVFNRWGNLLFETTSINNGWNGTYKGSKVSSGTYVYLIDYSFTEKRNTINRVIKGIVTLLK
jgi:gliding motility-associated-like protein